MSLTRSIRALVCQEAGNAAVEYAILLGLIVAVTFLGLDVLSRSTDSALDSVSTALQGGSPEAPRLASSNALSAESKLEAQAAQTNLMMSALVWGALSLCVVVGAGRLWYQSRRTAADNAREIAALRQEVAYVQPMLIAKRQLILKALAENVDLLLRSTLQVRQLMTTQVETVHPETSFETVKLRMQEKEIRHLLVVDHYHKLLGVISDRDVKSKHGKTAGHIMTRDPIAVTPDVEVSPAVTMMLDNAISCLPVVEKGQLKGVVTSTDLMMAVQCCMHLLRKFTSPTAAAVLPAATPPEDTLAIQELRRGRAAPNIEA